MCVTSVRRPFFSLRRTAEVKVYRTDRYIRLLAKQGCSGWTNKSIRQQTDQICDNLILNLMVELDGSVEPLAKPDEPGSDAAQDLGEVGQPCCEDKQDSPQ